MPAKILVIDNFDSFTYNLVHYLDDLNNGGVEVIRNNQLKGIKFSKYQYVVLSPGPGLPNQAGDLMMVLPELIASNNKVLGVCLGLQAIVEHFGGRLMNLKSVVHGQQTSCELMNTPDKFFKNISSPFQVGRYHSWVADKNYLPDALEILAVSDAQIMAIKHKSLPIYAVQFHPESVLTPQGKLMLKNWLNMY